MKWILEGVMEEKDEYNELKGLGGWLVLVQIGFILSILLLIPYFLIIIPSLVGGGVLLLLQFILYVFIGLLSIYCLILMYQKKKRFPKWAIFTLWFGFGFGVFVVITSFESIGKTIWEISKNLVPAIIWTAYYLKSRRVENTFVK